MSVIHLELPDLRVTQRFGGLLAADLRAGDVIALSGDLGVGKSALARSVIQAVDPSEDDVPSPTYTLVQQYALADGTPLWHLDLYRIEKPEDAMALGLDDAFIDAVCLIEWPDRLKKFLPQFNLSVHLRADDTAAHSSFRLADVTAPPKWVDRINDVVSRLARKSDS